MIPDDEEHQVLGEILSKMLPSLQEDSRMPQIRYNSDGSPGQMLVSSEAFSKTNFLVPAVPLPLSPAITHQATLGLSCLSPQNQLNEGYLEVTSSELIKTKVGLCQSRVGSPCDSHNLRDGLDGTRIVPSPVMSDMGYSDSGKKRS